MTKSSAYSVIYLQIRTIQFLILSRKEWVEDDLTSNYDMMEWDSFDDLVEIRKALLTRLYELTGDSDLVKQFDLPNHLRNIS